MGEGVVRSVEFGVKRFCFEFKTIKSESRA